MNLSITCSKLYLLFAFLSILEALYINSTDIASTGYSSALLPISVYDTLLRHAKFSALSYCTKRDLITTGNLKSACPCSLCYENNNNINVEYVYRGNVSGVIFKDDDRNEIILAIKGTTSNTEWLMDFRILPLPYHSLNKRKKGWKKYFIFNKNCKGCTIHSGFYEGAKEIYENLFDNLIKLSNDYPDYKLVVTGHSLGGAISPIIANELIFFGKHTTLISFGSPKIGNKQFTNWMNQIWNTDSHLKNIDNVNYNDAYLRVTHKNDPVPYLPTRQMNYNHAGLNLYFDKQDLPLTHDSLKIKTSSSSVADNSVKSDYVDSNFIKLAVGDNLQKSFDSHREYMLRMNKCAV